MTRWLAPLAATLVIEVPVVAALFAGQRAKMALVAVAANVATNLTLNLVLARSAALGGYQVPAGELFAVIVEAGAYGLASRPHDWAKGTLAASLGNALSFAAGFTGVLGSMWSLR
jgi:hypothetical protein